MIYSDICTDAKVLDLWFSHIHDLWGGGSLDLYSSGPCVLECISLLLHRSHGGRTLEGASVHLLFLTYLHMLLGNNTVL
jgi:hypothetical protein